MVVPLRDHQPLDDVEILNSFQDLDDPTRLESLTQAAQSSQSQDFVLDFGEEEAFVAFDLTAPSIASVVDAGCSEGCSTRWINIWYPQHHRSLLELLAKRYDFSPRLLALMVSDPKASRRPPTSQTAPQHTPSHKIWSLRQHSSPHGSDLEKGRDELSEQSSVSSYDSAAQGNLYRILDELWHYSSVDFGRNYVCIGYNSLYGTKHAGHTEGIVDDVLPQCTRVWTWLILCEDSTVIAIHEDPFPFAEGKLDAHQQRILTETRWNLVNVFRSLSMVEEDDITAQNPMTLLPIRTRLGDTPEESAHRNSDSPCLLFYYLFENWYNSYTLVTRKESRYGQELSKLRSEMLHAPRLCHIDRLDSIGKELGVLRRHYHSHERIIDRLLEPQIATLASLQNSRVVSSETSQVSLDTIRPLVAEKDSMLGVSLTSAARVRFKRQRDLIDLYALSEVEEYQKQKDSLVTMVSPPPASSRREEQPLTCATPELQPHRAERIRRHGPPDTSCTAVHKGDHPLPSRDFHVGLLRHRFGRCAVHGAGVLDRIRRDLLFELDGLGCFWYHQWERADYCVFQSTVAWRSGREELDSAVYWL